jgi:hypothetical protein
MRLTVKAINDELARRGYTARLAKSTGFFYFQFGEAAFWLDRTVNVPTLNSLTLPEWIAEFELLRRFNDKDIRGDRSCQYTAVQKPDKLSLSCSRIADSSSESSHSTTAQMPVGKISGKTEMVGPRRKESKTRRRR